MDDVTGDSARRGDGSYERRRWGEVLRVIYVVPSGDRKRSHGTN